MPTLSPTHLAAIARRRRLIVNFDVTFAINVQASPQPGPARPSAELRFEASWSICSSSPTRPSRRSTAFGGTGARGIKRPIRAKHLPLYDHPLYQKWAGRGDGYRWPSPRGHPAPRPRVLLFASHERLGQRPRPVCAHPRESRASRLAFSHALVYARGQRLLEFCPAPSPRLRPAQFARSNRALAF